MHCKQEDIGLGSCQILHDMVGVIDFHIYWNVTPVLKVASLLDVEDARMLLCGAIYFLPH